MLTFPFPDRLDSLEWFPARWASIGQQFRLLPDLIVIHSGDAYPNVAEFEHTTGEVFDAKGNRIRTKYHIAWSHGRGAFVQQNSLRREGWHSGGSIFRGNMLGQNGARHLATVNQRSLSIACPGPWDLKPRPEMATVKQIVCELIEIVPTLKYITAHSAIKRGKKDPGPGFDWGMMEGLGLEVCL